MAINKKLLHFVSKANFSTQLANSNIDSKSIVFIKDTGEIWTHDKLYSCASWGTNQTNYVPLTISGTSYNLSKDGHTHSYLPLSGGQLTGQLSLLQGADGGIIFPNDSFGGGGDSASIKLINPAGGESTEMTFTMTNDVDDIINFSVPSIDGVKINRYTVWNAGNFTNLNQLTTRNFSDLQNIPTTLSGYGITDALLKSDINVQVGGTKNSQMSWASWNNSDAYGGAIQIREYGYVDNTQSDWYYSPAISFHWSNRYVKRFGMRYDGQFAIDNNPILWSGNYSSYALPITGGTMTGQLILNGLVGDNYADGIRINKSSINWSSIMLGGVAGSTSGHDGTTNWFVATNPDSVFMINPINSSIGNGLDLYRNGEAKWRGSTIWHSGNFNPSNYLPLSGGTMTGSPYIYFPASANTSNLPDSTPTGLTYGRLQSFGTMTICGDTDCSTTEYVNITAGYSVANATAANGLSIGYSTLKWKGNTVWHSGNDGAGSGLDADLLDGTHLKSIIGSDTKRDFINGTLITTDIDYSGTNGDPFYLEIKGNVFGRLYSCLTQAQGYIYNNTIINYSVTHLGYAAIVGLIALNVNGRLCFWFPRQSYWEGYSIFVSSAYSTSYNRVIAVDDVAKPAGTKEVNISEHTSTSAFLNSNVASATKLQTTRTIWGQSFDGTGNVSGNLTSVGSIAASGDIRVSKDGAALYFGIRNQSYIGSNVGSDSYFWNAEGDAIRFGTGNGERMRISATGNVLIGTEIDSGYKLDVVGSGHFTSYIQVNGTINAYKDTPNGTTYNELGIQVYSGDGSPVGIGFHRGGYSQCILEHSGDGLTIRNSGTIGTGSLGNLTAANLFGNASTATTASNSYYQVSTGTYNDWVASFQNTPAHSTSFREMSAGGPSGTWWFMQNFRHSNGGSYWGRQIAWGWEDNAHEMYSRNITVNSFSGWVRFLNSSNYNSFSPTLTGGGASGTWGINISGNAATATRLQTTRTIWGQDFNGLDNVSGAMSGISTISASGSIIGSSFLTSNSPNYSLILRKSTEAALFVQNSTIGITAQIASFRYGSATAGAGTSVLNINTDSIVSSVGYSKAGYNDSVVLLGGGGTCSRGDVLPYVWGNLTVVNSSYITQSSVNAYQLGHIVILQGTFTTGGSASNGAAYFTIPSTIGVPFDGTGWSGAAGNQNTGIRMNIPTGSRTIYLTWNDTGTNTTYQMSWVYYCSY